LIKNTNSGIRLCNLDGLSAVLNILNDFKFNSNDEDNTKLFCEFSPKLFPCLTNIICSFKCDHYDLEKNQDLKGDETCVFVIICFNFNNDINCRYYVEVKQKRDYVVKQRQCETFTAR
jgi:hypothetical protein